MRMSPELASVGLASAEVRWHVHAALALFAFGIPLDALIATRIGSSSIVLGAPLAAVACWHMLVGNRFRPLPWPLILITGFVAWSAVSVLWARDQELFQIRTTTNIQLLLFVLLGWQLLDSERALSAALFGFVVGCIGLAAGVWKAFLAGEALGGYEGGTRFAAEGIDPNDMGVTLAIGFPMVTYLAVSSGRRARYLALGYFPLGWSAIALSGSRGATVTAVVAALGMLLWFAASRKSAIPVVLALLVGSVVLAWSYVPWETWERILTLGEAVEGGSTAGDRLQIWRAGLNVFAQVGAGGFSSSVIPALGARLAAHNTLLSVAVDVGGVGLLLFAGAFAASLPRLLKRRGDHLALGLTLLATWVLGSFSLTWDHRKTTWLVLLLCAALGASQNPGGQGETR
jgi:hypothetical protein